MRLWSINPRYLDSKGLVALWREALLAQKVLEDRTKGYKSHPQLIRFKQSRNPLASIGRYLYYIYVEAENRGYNFNSKKIVLNESTKQIKVTKGQINFEWEHLLGKLAKRDPVQYKNLCKLNSEEIEVHPLFEVTLGGIENWEKL